LRLAENRGLLMVGLFLLIGYVAVSQVSTPSKAPLFQTRSTSPPAAHVNAPMGPVPRMAGDGSGAYKTHIYRDLFAEQGHAATERAEPKSKRHFSNSFTVTARKSVSTSKPEQMRTARLPTSPIGRTTTHAPRA